MAITKERKRELVAQYDDVLSRSDGFVVAEYRFLSVAEMEQLRRKLRAANGVFLVTKNTLFTRALNDLGWPVPADLLLGPVGVAFGQGNLPAVAKEVLDFAKERDTKFSIKGGVMGTMVVDAAGVQAISALPTLDELRAQLAGLVVSPASTLAGLLNSATSQVVNVLQAYVDENTPKGEADAA